LREALTNKLRTIGFREGKGQHQNTDLFYIDENLSAGKYQYRLRQVDFDAGYEYSDILEVVISPSVYSLSQTTPTPLILD
jgi:hypothetical protein